MTVVIRTSSLSKSYVIAHERGERYTTLRDAISSKLAIIGKKSLHPFSNKRAAADRNKKEVFWALREVNVDIHQGERVGIIGRNGAGKSTLLKILSRITEPTNGRVQ